jgi:hypothetical protein
VTPKNHGIEKIVRAHKDLQQSVPVFEAPVDQGAHQDHAGGQPHPEEDDTQQDTFLGSPQKAMRPTKPAPQLGHRLDQGALLGHLSAHEAAGVPNHEVAQLDLLLAGNEPAQPPHNDA